jgi:hypothetical protein
MNINTGKRFKGRKTALQVHLCLQDPGELTATIAKHVLDKIL